MKIAIGCDHAGYQYRLEIIDMLEKLGHEMFDFGTDGDASVDYPDHVHPVAQKVDNAEVDLGILICGTGNGVAMTANKYKNVRAGLCWNEEIVSLTRQHNNANVLCLPARFINIKEALQFVHVFLNTDFEGGRHKRRVDKICM